MNTSFEPEKWIWTDEDFEQMSWHDGNIYAVASYPEEREFALDLDYLCRWIYPESSHKPPIVPQIGFWITPATMVFEDVSDIKVEFTTNGNIEIEVIERQKKRYPSGNEYWFYEILCFRMGYISLRAHRFKMYLKDEPVFHKGRQSLKMRERGGINFNRGRPLA